MKKLYYIIIIALIFQSCQIEDDATPRPEDAYIKYYGELASYEARDIELVYEGSEPSSVIVFGSKLTSRGDNDFYIQRTDLSGNLIDSITFGFNTIIDTDEDGISDFDLNEDGEFEPVDEALEDIFIGDDIPGKITITNDAILIIGSTSISANLPGRTISDWRQLVFTAFPLNTDFNTIDRESIAVLPIAAERDSDNPNSTVLDLEGKDIIALSDGGILLVGSKEFDRGGFTDFDNYFLKLQLSTDRRSVVFEKNLGVSGTNEDEEAIRVFEKTNGNLVLIGSGNTSSRLGENNGNNGRNAYFIELDPNGNPVNRRYYGVDHFDPANTAVFDETVTNAIQAPSGYIIVGTSTSSQNEVYGFAMSLGYNGEHLSSASLPSLDYGGLQTRFMGVTQARDNGVVLVGQYPGFIANEIGKSGEALFMKVDQSLISIPGNESNFGLTDGNDEFVDAVTLADGSIIVAGNIDFGAGIKLISIIKLNDTGNLED